MALLTALAMAATSAALLTATAASAATPDTIWGTAAPLSAVVDRDTSAVELGTRFSAVTSGQATGVRFYKTSVNSGQHLGSLWSSSGTLLGRVTFSNETSSGWQTATFASPITLTAGTAYVVSYHTNVGRYVSTQQFTGASASRNLKIPSSDVGVYTYGGTSAFPRSTWHASQYWVDLTFSTAQLPSPSASSSSVTATPTTTPSRTTSSTATGSTTSATTSGSTPSASTASTSTSPSTSTASSTPTITAVASTPTATNKTTKASTSSTTPSLGGGSSGGYPNATVTGVPAGTALKASSGTLTLSTNGQVVSGLDITGNVLITASNVTLQRSRITGGSWNIIQVSDSATNVTIQDVEINGTGSVEGANGIYGTATVLRTNIYGVENGIVPGSNSVLRDNYIHGLSAPGSPHYDGIQIDGGLSGITITHNYIDMHEWDQTSTVMVDNYFGSISNIAVDNNLLVGGGYTVYSDNQFNSSVISGVSFTNNRIGKGYWGYGTVTGPRPVWTGNVDATTGAAIAQP